DLIAMKKATGRPVDLVDVEYLGGHQATAIRDHPGTPRRVQRAGSWMPIVGDIRSQYLTVLMRISGGGGRREPVLWAVAGFSDGLLGLRPRRRPAAPSAGAAGARRRTPRGRRAGPPATGRSRGSRPPRPGPETARRSRECRPGSAPPPPGTERHGRSPPGRPPTSRPALRWSPPRRRSRRRSASAGSAARRRRRPRY